MASEAHAWIFVSHASADLDQVRIIRNRLEGNEASPLLFHLRALENPEEFWPLIEREIRARNFFLYCESEAAEQSEWVRREREAVAEASKLFPKKIGRVRVDIPTIDFDYLDAFVTETRIFVSYAHPDRQIVEQFVRQFRIAGFVTFFDVEDLNIGVDWRSQILVETRKAAEVGWIVVFVSRAALESEQVRVELEHARSLNAKIIPILLEDVPVEMLPSFLRERRLFSFERAPVETAITVVRELLTRG